LVSVRDLAEATSAQMGGADIIDIKDPSQGSLGMAPLDVIGSIVQQFSAILPVTAALGELADREAIPVGSARQLAGLWMVKVGTSRIDQPDHAFARFRSWSDALTGVTSLIPAIYADHRRCGGIDPKTGLDWALRVGSPALLIDTFVKDGRRLTDGMPLSELGEIAHACRAKGILLALAGSLRAEEIHSLADFEPAIWAVRGAVCGEGNRNGSVLPERVRGLADQIKCDRASQRG
jgi:uncharacterized protein (UPF0264 family)